MKFLKTYIYTFFLLAVISFGFVRSQQMDIYREIARSQQQIMTVYKYLLTEYIHELDVQELTTRIIDSMLSNFDPYTEYFEQKDLEDLSVKTEGEFSGVGLEIYMYEDQLTVVSPIEGSPASRSGIYTGDAIMNIDGVATEGLELKDATSKIRGKAGSEVVLTIKKPITGEIQDYPIIRDVITIKDIPFYGMVDDNVGYLRITNFSINTATETKDAIINLMQEGAGSVVIDLRDNPGGLLSSSLDLLDLILPKNLDLVSTRGRDGKNIKNYQTLNNALIPKSINLAVLINGGSASASEIVAGVLQDHDRAVIGINQDTALKITNSKYYIPSGRSLQKREFIDDKLIASSSTISDSLFQTKAGRTVKGGGGISPDIVVTDEGSYPLAAAILRNGAYFKFVQQNSDKYKSIDEVLADPDLMLEFETFITENDINGYVDGQEDLRLAKDKLANEDKKNLFMSNAFSVIEKQIQKTQSLMFENEKKLIQRVLHGEFAFYYNGYEGRYNLYLKDDKVVLKALEVFNDESNYLSILSNSSPEEVALNNN
jgi:carboxyl-terminal processing protease